MATYAKIENNTVIEYPVYEGTLKDRFPDILFPLDVNNTPIPTGYVEVLPNYVVDPKTSCRYDAGTPAQADGVWKQIWIEVPYTQEQKDVMAPAWSIQVRAERNKRLSATDWTQFADVTLSDTLRAEILVYRQALRDITTQANFPFDMVWPVSPI
jgi:hypothetical protein